MTLVPSTKPTSKSAPTTLSINKRPSHKHQLSEVLARQGEEGWLEDATFEDEHTEQDGDDEEERERSRGMTVDLGRLVEHAGEMRGPSCSLSLLSIHHLPLPPFKLLPLPISLSEHQRPRARAGRIRAELIL